LMLVDFKTKFLSSLSDSNAGEDMN
jgi:hypothetical protein